MPPPVLQPIKKKKPPIINKPVKNPCAAIEAELVQQKALVLKLQQQNSLLRSALRKEKELTAGEKLENELLHDELKQMGKNHHQAASTLQRLQKSLRAERAEKERLQQSLEAALNKPAPKKVDLGSLKAQVAATKHHVDSQAEELQQQKRTITEEDRIKIRKAKGAPTSRRYSDFMDHVKSRSQAEADFSAVAAATHWKRKGKTKA